MTHFTHDNNGSSILCVSMQKSLYSMMQSAMLFFMKFVHHISMIGSTLDTCTFCDANTILNENNTPSDGMWMLVCQAMLTLLSTMNSMYDCREGMRRWLKPNSFAARDAFREETPPSE
jgi:hypothetical protein